MSRKRSDKCVSIKEHFTAMILEQDRRIEQSLVASREAVTKASAAQERRLDLLNEFRAQAADESKKYALRESLTTLDNQVSRLYGGLVVIGVIGVANLVKLFFH